LPAWSLSSYFSKLQTLIQRDLSIQDFGRELVGAFNRELFEHSRFNKITRKEWKIRSNDSDFKKSKSIGRKREDKFIMSFSGWRICRHRSPSDIDDDASGASRCNAFRNCSRWSCPHLISNTESITSHKTSSNLGLFVDPNR
jgi:hypothetical protein